MAEIIPHINDGDMTYLEELSNRFNGPTDALKERMDEALKAIEKDPTDSAGMAKFQSAMASYTTMRAAQSGVTKSLKDAVQGVISKY
ncbi:EscF/YscF/HrpA family type III secretion system needle major subunit [Pandoraea aquatica]|uniref:EscF/YscF/HrpA family type III secretion system needle major subunit n=1 Tax=Pandoraea aquatica TaxID=2508290 RepID=A0A5E4TCG9_9BURK|nr:type III secretion system needle filament subunit SctF [Pandoraea aquatica]VVD85467.1 EscF/YscF/HrpA family type III secretion system needle major subunit [Pandoraea aquatica]